MDKDALLSLIASLERRALFFGILVAIGVAGESVFGIRLYWNNRKLHRIEDQESQTRKAEVARLKHDTEKLRKENLELELKLSPRIFDDQGGAADRLKGFAPIDAKIEYLSNDRECRDTARQIFFVFQAAGWNVAPCEPNPNDSAFWPDGVSVEFHPTGEPMEAYQRRGGVINALLSELNLTHIEARLEHPSQWESPPPPDVVRVRVGRRPNPRMERIEKEWLERAEKK
jgi:hypothetical protein